MKKGITLVELLAVIIILGIVTSIAVPIVLNVISVSRMNAYVKNVEMVRKAASVNRPTWKVGRFRLYRKLWFG